MIFSVDDPSNTIPPSQEAADMDLEPTSSIFGRGRCATSTLHRPGKIFEFFKLPLELRQHIFDETLDRKKVVLYDGKNGVALFRLHHVQLLLVSHRFKDELEQRAVALRLLLVQGEGHVFDDPQFLTRAIQSAPPTELRLEAKHRASGSYAQNSVDSLMNSEEFGNFRDNLLSKLLEITESRTVSVELVLLTDDNPSKAAIAGFGSDLSTLTSGCTFKAFNVYILDDVKYVCSGTYSKKLVICYSRQTESFQCMFDEEEYREEYSDELNEDEDEEEDEYEDHEDSTEDELAQVPEDM